jgi:hypothetical protein
MAPTILATFKLSPDQWDAFKERATDRGSNASQVLKRLVAEYLEGRLDNLLDAGIDDLNRIDGSSLDESIDARIDEKLKRINSYLDQRIDERLKSIDTKPNRIDEGIDAPKKRSRVASNERTAIAF